MTNPHKGEVEIIAGEQAYKLRYSIDALVALETEAGKLDGLRRKGFHKIATELNDLDTVSISLARVVLWAGLRENHPEIDIKAAGEVMLAAGGVVKVLEKVNEAFEAAFPPAEKPEEAAEPSPQMPSQDGTGSAS
jgi:hypothetical protein